MQNRRPCLLAIGLLLLLSQFVQAQADPLVEAMVAAVSQTRVTATVQTLQDFGTRFTYTQGNTDAGDWLFAYFESLGLEAERHAFSWGGNDEENIIARIPGLTNPEEIIVISGHFDSTSEQPYTNAPGADDDASAIAAVLEAALIFRDYGFDRSIEFMCFNAEEQGRRGSAAIAGDYLAAGKDLVAVVNSDMIGYWPTGWARDLDVAYEPVSEWLADAVIAASNTYVGIPIAKHPSGVCQDDHYAFTQLGISAITNMDCWEAHNTGSETTPHYHKTTDTVATLNLPCMTQAIQVSVAAVAELAGPRTLTAVADTQAPRGSLRLLGNQPNPFNPKTEIRFSSDAPGAWTALQIFTARGRLVREIHGGAYDAGTQLLTWDGRDDRGEALPSGVYLYQVLSDRGATSAKKAVILK